MFVKLFKYEFRHNAKIIAILSVVALFVALVGGLAMNGLIQISFSAESMAPTAENTMLMMFVMMSLLLLFYICIAGLGAYIFAVMLVNLWRFYKHKFTDEGYLTFTLPVKTRDIWFSSLLSNFLWLVIAYAVFFVGMIGMYTVGFVPMLWETGALDALKQLLQMVTWQDWQNLAKELWEALKTVLSVPGYVPYMLLNMLLSLLAPVYSMVLMMTCVTVGSVLVKRFKVLLSVGLYVGVTALLSALAYIGMVLPMLAMVLLVDYLYWFMCAYMLFALGMYVVVIVGGCWLSMYLMKKKLNLP